MAEVIRPPWLPDGLYQIWLTYYIAAGGQGGGIDAEVTAIEQTRQDARYESYFPGILREDGTIRYPDTPEQTYYTNIAAFRNTIEGLRMSPDVFAEDYISLIEGDVSPNEFKTRVTALQDRVLSQGQAINDWYAENFGFSLTPEGILAGLMSERINDAILTKQITMAEIGGEASMRNFDITTEFVNLLEQAGMNRQEAQEAFGTAESVLPVLQSLAARHGNPDDPFDIYDFVSATELMDPEQSRLMRTYKAQEESMFTGGAQVELVRSEAGGLGGLEPV